MAATMPIATETPMTKKASSKSQTSLGRRGYHLATSSAGDHDPGDPVDDFGPDSYGVAHRGHADQHL